jgi:hypothetical protein
MMPPITASRRIRTDIPMPAPAPALSGGFESGGDDALLDRLEAGEVDALNDTTTTDKGDLL